jgi:hypothetical protein
VVGFVGARGIKADVDAVVLATVRVIHLTVNSVSKRRGAREYLVVEAEV